MTALRDCTYDSANRLTGVDGVPYTWDANGNLLSDGVSTYTYNHANQLTGVAQGAANYSFAYDGLGNRLRQITGANAVNYVLDISGGLTQVLTDGTNTYLYGLERIAQGSTGGMGYYLGDALGSVRQMADAGGGLTLSRNYEPYGTAYAAMGSASTAYGFTGEWTDGTGLVNLRARYYAANQGRFVTKDIWQGDTQHPISFNTWLYVYANPIKLTDPSGNNPGCNIYERADLTQWLIDELNTTRKSNLAYLIRSGLASEQRNSFSEITSLLFFYESVKTHGLFDFKWAIKDIVGGNIILVNHWYNYMAPGNIHFAYFGMSVGFNKETLHCGADFANNKKWCSGADENEDYEAIEVGIDIFKLSGGGDVNEPILRAALAIHPLANPGVQHEPKINSYYFQWPYPIGTFDDQTGSWIVKHR